MTSKNILYGLIGVFIIVVVVFFMYFNATTDVMVPGEVQSETPSGPATAGKIDINAVCEGALSYMTFTDGAASDTFVAECKEGKHPEVIEKFKADLNVGTGAQL